MHIEVATRRTPINHADEVADFHSLTASPDRLVCKFTLTYLTEISLVQEIRRTACHASVLSILSLAIYLKVHC